MLSSGLSHLGETELRGEPESVFLGIEEKSDNRPYYETYGRYRTRYIRHYSPEVYDKQMERYRNHEIKSRPNGQKRCYVSGLVEFYRPEDYHIAYSRFDPRSRLYKKHSLKVIYRSS
jgi:hypothetical protein